MYGDQGTDDLDEELRRTKPADHSTDSWGEIPDGKYIVTIHQAELKTAGVGAKYPGSRYIGLQLKIVSPQNYAKRLLFMNRSLSTPENRAHFAADLILLGIDRSTFMVTDLSPLLDIELEVSKRKSGSKNMSGADNYFVNFNRRTLPPRAIYDPEAPAPEETPSDAAAEAPARTEDDIPF